MYKSQLKFKLNIILYILQGKKENNSSVQKLIKNIFAV